MAVTAISHTERNVERCRVDRAEALRYLGYANQQMSSDLDERISRAIERCERISRPAYAFRFFPIETCRDAAPHGVALCDCSLDLPGKSIEDHLRDACGAAIMACTLGLANERESRIIAQTDNVGSLIFGAAGSSLAESTANACEAAIVAEAAEQGLITNGRFSPGYGDLPLTLQPKIVSILGADRTLGLTTTEANLIIPMKSITAIIGLFDADRAPTDADGPRGAKHNCADCVCFDHCNLRKAGTPCYR